MRRILLPLLLALSLISCASKDAALDTDQTPRSRYTGDVGESPVGVIPEASLRDNARNRELGMAIEYPTRPGPHPLIVFSHGFGSQAREYAALSSFWASQGYVVIRPAHADAGKGSTPSGGREAWENRPAGDWNARVDDMLLVIDQLDQLEQRYPELQGKIDRAKIGVGGHSYGAMTAMLLGGAQTQPGTARPADPRIKAVVAMGPPGPGASRGLTEQSWAQLTKPALFIVGTAENGADETETPEWRRRAYELSPAGDKWLVVLDGGGYSAYTGRMSPVTPGIRQTISEPSNDPGTDPKRIPGQRPVITEPARTVPREGQTGLRTRGAFSTVKALSLAFWDTYLRESTEGRTALEAGGSRGGVTLEKK
ncbi:MAG TPA: alpha/beta fold hydrolase [Thermoanaerobaculia bacterium]|nr:alpha/beta fold hydrolase [Thermoanaerobaculia bacterium]